MGDAERHLPERPHGRGERGLGGYSAPPPDWSLTISIDTPSKCLAASCTASRCEPVGMLRRGSGSADLSRSGVPEAGRRERSASLESFTIGRRRAGYPYRFDWSRLNQSTKRRAASRTDRHLSSATKSRTLPPLPQPKHLKP